MASAYSNSTVRLQDIVHYARSIAELTPVLGVSGWALEPALSIANEVMQRILAQPLAWKWNRAYITPFTTNSLQQDYVNVQALANGIVMPDQNWLGVVGGAGMGGSVGAGSILNMGWLESGTRVDINNTSYPQPRFPMEAVRDLPASYWQATPFNLSWIPIPLAIYGTWLANTKYPTGYGNPQTPLSPIQQIIDANGNYLYVSTSGTTGGSAPLLAANTTPGTTVNDGSVVWTVADPRGVAIRLSPIPPSMGIVWQVQAVYRLSPPTLTSLTQTMAPIPDTMRYVFQQGFVAGCRDHLASGSRDSLTALDKWQRDLITGMRSADRETDNFIMYPSTGIAAPWGGGFIGPANPYGFGSAG